LITFEIDTSLKPMSTYNTLTENATYIEEVHFRSYVLRFGGTTIVFLFSDFIYFYSTQYYK